jgi:hypothetical protein
MKSSPTHAEYRLPALREAGVFTTGFSKESGLNAWRVIELNLYRVIFTFLRFFERGCEGVFEEESKVPFGKRNIRR